MWSALIGQAFLDAFEILGDDRFLDVAESVCRWILALPRERTHSGTCLSYHMLEQNSVHNANMLGAAMLARVWRHSGQPECLDMAAAAMQYSCSRQRPDGSWWYGEDTKYHWIDNFHTGYNLDSLQCYIESTGDLTFQPQLDLGFRYFKDNFFEATGRPVLSGRAYPIHFTATAIKTLTNSRRLPRLLCGNQSRTVDDRHMQDSTGFYYSGGISPRSIPCCIGAGHVSRPCVALDETEAQREPCSRPASSRSARPSQRGPQKGLLIVNADDWGRDVHTTGILNCIVRKRSTP